MKYKACLRLKWLLLWKELSRNFSAGGVFENMKNSVDPNSSKLFFSMCLLEFCYSRFPPLSSFDLLALCVRFSTFGQMQAAGSNRVRAL